MHVNPTVTQNSKDAVSGVQKDTFIVWWMIIVHLLALWAFAYMSWTNFFVGLAFYFITGCLGVTLGYHRLMTHRSFKAPRWFERTVATFGTLSLQGGPLEWVAHHRMHHAATDTPADPHNARRGFWFSHIGWLFQVVPQFDDEAVMRKYGRDIICDPYMEFLNRNSTQIGIQVALGLVLWAVGGWGMVLWGVFLRLIAVYHTTWLVNSACHMWGYRSYKTDELSRNCWWVALLTWGEGWHNNHHAHGNVALAGYRWWEFDVTFMIIRTLEVFGIVWDVRRPPEAGDSNSALAA